MNLNYMTIFREEMEKDAKVVLRPWLQKVVNKTKGGIRLTRPETFAERMELAAIRNKGGSVPLHYPGTSHVPELYQSIAKTTPQQERDIAETVVKYQRSLGPKGRAAQRAASTQQNIPAFNKNISLEEAQSNIARNQAHQERIHAATPAAATEGPAAAPIAQTNQTHVQPQNDNVAAKPKSLWSRVPGPAKMLLGGAAGAAALGAGGIAYGAIKTPADAPEYHSGQY